MKVAIVGSGLSGLTAGAFLAQAGHQVVIFEQYPRLGGVTAPFEKDGYKWDLGQLNIEGIGLDEPVGQVLSELGISSQVSAVRVDRGYVFPDSNYANPSNTKVFSGGSTG